MLPWIDWLRHQIRLRRQAPDRAWGQRGEDLAHRHLRSLGYVIVARNFRTRSGAGEVDLVAWDGDALAFVEVKTRATDAIATPDRAVDTEKQRKLRIAARDYTRRADVAFDKARFDIVSIVLRQPVEITLLKDAFGKQ